MRREQILDAANELFAERGYEDVTVEDVAQSAGVAHGLVHHVHHYHARAHTCGAREVATAILTASAAITFQVRVTQCG